MRLLLASQEDELLVDPADLGLEQSAAAPSCGGRAGVRLLQAVAEERAHAPELRLPLLRREALEKCEARELAIARRARVQRLREPVEELTTTRGCDAVLAPRGSFARTS